MQTPPRISRETRSPAQGVPAAPAPPPSRAPCSHLAKPVPLVHQVDPVEVFDPREHGEDPGIGVVHLWTTTENRVLKPHDMGKGPGARSSSLPVYLEAIPCLTHRAGASISCSPLCPRCLGTKRRVNFSRRGT